MRNLKKILALVLALVMSMSMLATANAFKDEKDIDPDFNEAIAVLSNLGVFQGYNDGETFQPKGSITRAEVAAIIYRIVTGDVADKQVKIYSDYNKFDDVKSASWYAGYVNFCANAEIIKGYSATKFGPNDTVTGYQALAMILRAIGYDKNGEFTGAGWQVQTAAVAKKLNITKKIAAGTLGTAATREMVAEILFRTIAYAPQVNYTLAFGYSDFGTETLGYETFKLFDKKDVDDVWGRPSSTWYLDLNANKKIDAADAPLVSLAYAPVVSYETPVAECQIAVDTAQVAREKTYVTYTNGMVNANKQVINTLDTKGLAGTAQGRQTLVYTDRIVYIDTMLAAVTNVTEVKYDAAGHIRNYAKLYLDVYYTNTDGTKDVQPIVLESATDWTYIPGDMLLINAVEDGATGKVVTGTKQHVEIVDYADSMVGAQTIIWKNVSQHTVEDQVYDDAVRFHLDQAGDQNTNHTWYFDQFGNLIGATDVATEYGYGVISNLYWENIHGAGAAYIDITYMDGTVAEDVVLHTIKTWDVKENKMGGYVPTYALMNTVGYTGTTLYVSTDAANNKGLTAGDMYQILTRADGSVDLVEVTTQLGAATIEGKYAIVSGTPEKQMVNNFFKTNNATQYLVKTATGFVALTGFNEIYNYTKTATWVDSVDVNRDGFADYVYIIGTPDASTGASLVLVESTGYKAYVGDDGITYYEVYVTLVDGTEATVKTTEFDKVVKVMTKKVDRLFYVTYKDGLAQTATQVEATPISLGGNTWVVCLDNAKYNNGVLFVDNTINNNYNVTSATEIYGSLADLEDKFVYVVYTASGVTQFADSIYVVDKNWTVNDTPDPDPDPATVTWVVNFYDSMNGFQSTLSKKVVSSVGTFVAGVDYFTDDILAMVGADADTWEVTFVTPTVTVEDHANSTVIVNVKPAV